MRVLCLCAQALLFALRALADTASIAQVYTTQGSIPRSVWSTYLTDPKTPSGTQSALKSALVRQRHFCQDAYPADVERFKQSQVFSDAPSPFFIYVRSEPDVVSSQVLTTGKWADDLLRDIYFALEYNPPVQGAAGAAGAGAGAAAGAAAAVGGGAGSGEGTKSRVFIDVGANFGWLTMNVAARGYRVAAVEAMKHNQKMLRNSLCAHPDIMGRVVLFATGVSNDTATCYMYSDDNNQGNGHSMCGLSEEAVRQALPPGHSIRDSMAVQRLDALLGGVEVQVMKIDVEGFEPMVMYGAAEMLRAGKIKFVCMEFFPDFMQRNLHNPNATIEFIDFLVSLPYRISILAFDHGYMTPAQAAVALRGDRTRDDIFLAHESLPLVAGVL
ncbi:hypothetical protein HYH03_019000 [Edaphochlamys debaryana]|uniref:Methyltransferase FkbM domain-containing protein n=1 Tax=Edaphochlamys debaryana TaxID=47281 RepID=A0A836BML1_9CHLO|nr:hypothetical protein HYH03_019000 [Edaphochlamys debaryana]|eukprot:KAG2482050.1 hypothetical protein HYH03_019000 [Edaphochlamys debaryana]